MIEGVIDLKVIIVRLSRKLCKLDGNRRPRAHKQPAASTAINIAITAARNNHLCAHVDCCVAVCVRHVMMCSCVYGFAGVIVCARVRACVQVLMSMYMSVHVRAGTRVYPCMHAGFHRLEWDGDTHTSTAA